MKGRTFAAFVAPSLVMMLVFIAAPLASVFLQSFQNERTLYRQDVSERCTPGFPNPICTTETRTIPVLRPDGSTATEMVYVGIENYRTLLDPAGVAEAIATGAYGRLFSIDFYKALAFTLLFTFVTLPLVLGLGLALALALNSTRRSWRGPIIFVTLLPFIITPVIGSLSIKWLFAGDGLMTAALQWISGTRMSLLADTSSLALLMTFYRVWHVAPFAFIIFYAALQSLNQDTMDAATVDGASRYERLRYVIVPHLKPLIVFVALIHLMDTYRVFDEIVGFSSQAHIISLQWLTFDLLNPDATGNRAIGRASASSMLTMIGIVILLVPLMWNAWRDRRIGG
jgi:multiple sugar transport system permease protein